MSDVSDYQFPQPLRILLVDDDTAMTKLVAHSLKTYFGSAIMIFDSDDPHEAGEILQDEPIDIVITDLDMKDINGFHLLKSVKSRDPISQVVILTAHDCPNAIRSAYTMGADEYFVKPVSPKDLIDCVSYLGKRLKRWDSRIKDLRLVVDADSPVDAA